MRTHAASRVYQRWEAQIGIPFAYVALVKFSFLLLTMGHWMACGWTLTATLQREERYTWLDSMEDKFGAQYEDPTPFSKYAAALYWAITTITSVGYGDITPQNAEEMFICTLFLLVGSILWAYIIGALVISMSMCEHLPPHRLPCAQTTTNLAFLFDSSCQCCNP